MTVRFAWPSYTKPWAVDLDNVRVDDRAEVDCVDSARRRVRLDHVGVWRSVAFDMFASTEEPEPSEVGPISAFAVVSSPRANTRIPFRLDPVGPGAFAGTIALSRAAVAGVAALSVELAAEVEGRQRLIGIGEDWNAIVEASDAPTPPGKPPFDTAWIDFRDTAAPMVARQQPDAYAVMDLSDMKPKLLLNESVDGLKELLLPASARHEKRRLREIIGTSIAKQAATTLIRAAANEIVPGDPEEPEPQVPLPGLYAQICDAIAAEMTTVASVSDFYDRLVTAARGSSLEYSDFWGEVDAAVDRLTGHSSAVAAVVGEVKYV